MSISRIRSRIESLERKLALPLAVVRLKPLAEEFCHQSLRATADRKPPPDAQPFVEKIVEKGFLLGTFMRLRNYIERCQQGEEVLEPMQIVRVLLPWAYRLSLIWYAFQYDSPASA